MQTGKETLEKFYRVHFTGPRKGEMTMERQGQPNPRAFVASREDWELSGSFTILK
jgi:hypothetical protein